MARKSRKNTNREAVSAGGQDISRSRAGIYARLSVEDNNYKNGDSIQNQVNVLNEYVQRNESEFQLVQAYLDNGTTGTNFDREGWNNLVDDIKAGKIDCVIVKDFSRIGRNYIEVGNYLEKIFPFLGVRVVSINDGFDSKKQSFENNMLMNSLMNIVNEYYARDISKKILQAKKVMQKKGEYTSGVYPYGYKKSDADRRKLEIDTEAASVVKKIFEWRVRGKSCPWIANYLNELAIPSPGLYRFMNGKQSFKKCQNSKWKAEQVSTILRNPVYLGHMVQGKSQASYFRNNGKKQRVPREQWNIVKDTHEPLVSQEQYDIVQGMAAKSKKKYDERMNAHADMPHVDNPIRRKVFCGQCGRMMFRRSKVEHGVRNYFYYCDTSRRVMDAECRQAYFREALLMDIVRQITEKHLQLLGDFKREWSKKNIGQEDNRKKRGQNSKDKPALEQEVLFIKKQKRELYIDMKEGMIAQGDFKSEWERLSIRQMQCEEKIMRIQDGGNLEKKEVKPLLEYSDDVFVLKKDDISLALLDDLIEKIFIVSQDKIEVAYVYEDMIKRWFGEDRRNFSDKKGAENHA